jgi:hypothetical protein
MNKTFYNISNLYIIELYLKIYTKNISIYIISPNKVNKIEIIVPDLFDIYDLYNAFIYAFSNNIYFIDLENNLLHCFDCKFNLTVQYDCREFRNKQNHTCLAKKLKTI